MFESVNATHRELYEHARTQIEVAKTLLKAMKPLDDLLTHIQNSYGILPQAFSTTYQLHQTMLQFQDELKVEELSLGMKSHGIKWSQHIHRLSWGKLPALDGHDSVNAFEHQLQVIITAKDWIKLQTVLNEVITTLTWHFGLDSHEEHPIHSEHDDQAYLVNQLRENIHAHLKSITDKFHSHVTKVLSGDVPLDMLEKVHDNAIILQKLLLSLDDLALLAHTISGQWKTLRTIKFELSEKMSDIEAMLDSQEFQDINFFLSILELSRQANHIMKDIEAIENKVTSIYRDFIALNHLINALESIIQSHPLNDIAESMTAFDERKLYFIAGVDEEDDGK